MTEEEESEKEIKQRRQLTKKGELNKQQGAHVLKIEDEHR